MVSIERISRKKEIFVFGINLLVLLAVYGRLLGEHLSPDFFAVHINGASELPHHIRNGRIVYGIVLCIVQGLGLSVTTYASGYTFLFMCISAFCVMRISMVLCRAVGQNGFREILICAWALLIGLINISMMEWYFFLECMLMYSLSLLFASEGALVFSRREWSLCKRAAVSFAAMCVSINCYQACLSWYITLALICILATTEFKPNRNAVVEGVAAMAIGGSSAVLNQLIVRFASTFKFIGTPGRQASFSYKDFIGNAIKSIPIQRDFLRNGFSLLPTYFLFAAFCAGVILSLLAGYMRNQGKAWMKQAAWVLSVLCICYTFVYIPHFAANHMNVAPRSIVGLFLVLSMCFVLAILMGTKWIRVLSIACVAGILTVSYVHISQTIDDHLLTSQRDMNEAEKIVSAIDAHEQAGGELIEEVCVVQDTMPNYYYSDIQKCIMDINLRQMHIEWEQVNIIMALSGRTFEHVFASKGESDSIVQGRNWDEFVPEEQLVFEGNRLYIITY